MAERVGAGRTSLAAPAATDRRPGEALRAARLARGVSLRRLARDLGVSPATLSAVETGRTPVTVDRLRAAAELLDTPLERLVAGRPAVDVPQVPVPPDGVRHWRHYPPLALGPVLTAAMRVFVAKGFHGATVRDVAAEANLSVPGVYHHHPSKADMLVELFDIGLAELRWRLLAARDEDGTEAQRFAAMVESLALFHAIRVDLAFLGLSEMRGLPEGEAARIAQVRTGIQHLLDEQAQRAMAAGELSCPDPHTATRAISTMCTSLTSWFREDGRLTAQQVAVRYADYALALLGAPS